MKNFELVSTNVTSFCVTRNYPKYSYFIITMKKLISLFIPELLTLSFIVFNAF